MQNQDKEKNRKACPITASMVDEFREIFGDKVCVKKTDEKRIDK